jgi:zinc protease
MMNYRKTITLAAFLFFFVALLPLSVLGQGVTTPRPQESPATTTAPITTPVRAASRQNTTPQTQASPPISQNQAMPPNEDFRRTAPQPLAPRPINIPTPVEFTLSNGLRVVLVEDSRLPLVTYRMLFRAGDARNPADAPGLLDFVNDLVTEGTETRTSRQIDEELARIGASLSAVSNADYTTVSASSLSFYNDQLLNLMADVLLRPTFPQAEIDLLKNNTRQALQLQRTQPGFLQNERFSRVLYGDHPYSIVSTNPEAIDRITRERIMEFYRQVYTPANGILIVVGDVRRETLTRRLNELFANWRGGESMTQTRFPAPPARTARTIYVVDRPGSAQSSIAIGNLGIARNSPDYFPALLMNTVLGSGISSRLDLNLRENKGYTYGAGSSFDMRREAGTFQASAEVRTPVTGASLREFFFELDRLRAEGITEEELNSAKSYLTGIFPLRLETQEGLINQLVTIKMFDLPANYLQTYRERVNAVTREQIQQAARQYVQSDRAAIVIVGDAGQIMDQIRPFAQNIEIYDQAGNRRETPTTGGATPSTNTGSASTADPVGAWAIQITLPNGQSIPATLNISREASALNGTISSEAGSATLSNMTLSSNNLTSQITLNMQGQTIEGQVAGRIEGDRMTGTITIQGTPINFTGTRSRQ